MSARTTTAEQWVKWATSKLGQVGDHSGGRDVSFAAWRRRRRRRKVRLEMQRESRRRNR